MAIKSLGQTIFYDDEVLQIGGGPTASRPVSPVIGMIRFNTDQNFFEAFNGTEWIFIELIKPGSGEILSWGSNNAGQLGDGTEIFRSSPVSVIGGFTDWIQVDNGDFHALGVRENGTAWAWGFAPSGRLGDNTITSKSSPVSVVGDFTDWAQVSGGRYHSLGVRQNGTAWGWGSNFNGPLGDNSSVDRSSPVSVVGGFTDWTQVSGGGFHSLGVRENGTAWAWGFGGNGSLGSNNTIDRSSPVSVVGGFTDWAQVSAGNLHSLGVRLNGTAWSWGLGLDGRLGDGTEINRSSPVSVVGGFTDWIQVSGNFRHSVAVRQSGTTWAWGNNGSGQIGDGSTTNRSSPRSVIGGFTDWIQVSAGRRHSLGLRENGTAWAWGNNNDGQLGNETTIFSLSPVSVIGGFSNWIQVSGGAIHSSGIRYIK